MHASCLLLQALDCFQRASKAAGGTNTEYAARIKVLRQKTNSQQQAAKVGPCLWF
jgi:hypothetical protein